MRVQYSIPDSLVTQIQGRAKQGSITPSQLVTAVLRRWIDSGEALILIPEQNRGTSASLTAPQNRSTTAQNRVTPGQNGGNGDATMRTAVQRPISPPLQSDGITCGKCGEVYYESNSDADGEHLRCPVDELDHQ